MQSVIWIDSDADGSEIEFVEPPTPQRRKGPLAGPSSIVNTPRVSKTKKKRPLVQSSDSEIEIIQATPKGAKIQKSAPPRDDTDADEDRAVALALQKRWDEEDALAQKRAKEIEDADLSLIAHLQEMDQKMAEKRQQLAQSRDVPDDGIVFQVVIDAEGKTIEGDDDPDNAAHLEEVKRDFEQALANNMKIKTVHWFVNAKLEARFEAAKATLMALGIDSTERNLFHGTAATNIQPILKGGFLIPGVSPGIQMVHGAACGIGIYLATSPATSLGYTQGASRMFMCRVITGRSTPMVTNHIPLPLGQDSFESYSSGAVYVVKYVDLVVPRYVVEFEMPGALHPYGGLMRPAAIPALPPAPAPAGGANWLGIYAGVYAQLAAMAPPVVAPPVLPRNRAPAKPRAKRAVAGTPKGMLNSPPEDRWD
ncbi:hypothetical protein C8F04DRAFT_1123805 [Mycena alexandri]|uniref:PARP catalytic domain-containing protein n=1 Tax=Mycena alexandri TaxID=1745969 RepID=A0AAD6SK16_9AGAR|nr:hypothetical protein C8F04DRAFT_1123805 [Mycena alexandri]